MTITFKRQVFKFDISRKNTVEAKTWLDKLYLDSATGKSIFTDENLKKYHKSYNNTKKNKYFSYYCFTCFFYVALIYLSQLDGFFIAPIWRCYRRKEAYFEAQRPNRTIKMAWIKCIALEVNSRELQINCYIKGWCAVQTMAHTTNSKKNSICICSLWCQPYI